MTTQSSAPVYARLLEDLLDLGSERVCKVGRPAFSDKPKNVRRRRKNRQRRRWERTIEHRVRIGVANGGCAAEIRRRCRRERAEREAAVLLGVRHLLSRLLDAIGEGQSLGQYETTVRRAERRLTAPERRRAQRERQRETLIRTIGLEGRT